VQKKTTMIHASAIRPIAIYLPQFHPIPENDEWWGKGFTEWTNVTKARPLFSGHYQPQLPADFGYYDLRLPETMEYQAATAKRYGLEGFMFYHYWFNGKRILQTPIDNYRDKVKTNFPYFFCWANENWSRRWDGTDKEMLLQQNYSFNDDVEHIRFLFRFFEDDRYMRVDGKPVLVVYKTEFMPDPQRTASIWREVAQKHGFPDLYLIRVEATDWSTRPAEIGFDAAMQFQPDWRNIYKYLLPQHPAEKILMKLYDHRYAGRIYKKITKKRPYSYPHLVIDYKRFSEDFYDSHITAYKRYPCVTPSWDNYSRRQKGGAMIFHNASPDLYEKWLHQVALNFVPYSGEENFIFINAWNEWAEGNHLEPCLRWKTGYLEATKKALAGIRQSEL